MTALERVKRERAIRMSARAFVDKVTDGQIMTPDEYQHLIDRVIKALPPSVREPGGSER